MHPIHQICPVPHDVAIIPRLAVEGTTLIFFHAPSMPTSDTRSAQLILTTAAIGSFALSLRCFIHEQESSYVRIHQTPVHPKQRHSGSEPRPCSEWQASLSSDYLLAQTCKPERANKPWVHRIRDSRQYIARSGQRNPAG